MVCAGWFLAVPMYSQKAGEQPCQMASQSLVLWRQEKKGEGKISDNFIAIFALALKSVVHMQGKGNLVFAISSRMSSKEFTSSILCLVLDWPQSREFGQSCFWCLDTSLALFLPHPFRGLCTHGFSIVLVSQIGKILFFAWPDKLLQG